MLHLLTDYAYCFVWQDKALLVKYRGWLKPKILAKEWVRADSGELFSKLGATLKRAEWRCRTNVVLCGGLVNYRLIKHDARLNDMEHQILAKHQFEQVYGKSAANWQVFMQAMRFEKNNLAIAVDNSHIQKLLSVFDVVKIKLVQMRPCLVEWLNSVRNDLPKDGWAVFIDEHELLSLKIRNRELLSCSQYKVSNTTNENVWQILNREAIALGEQLDNESIEQFLIVEGRPVKKSNHRITKYSNGQTLPASAR